MADRPPVTNRRPDTAATPAPPIEGQFEPPPFTEVANNNFSAADGGVVVTDGEGNAQTLTPQMLAAQNEQSLQPLTYGRVGGALQAPGAGAPVAPGHVVPASTKQVVAAGPAPSQASAPAPARAEEAPAASPAMPAAAKPVARTGRRIAGAPPPPVAAAEVVSGPQASATPGTARPPVSAPAEVAPATERVVVPAAADHAVQPPRPVQVAKPALSVEGLKLLEASRAIGSQAQRSHQPAASESDSPSRGIPRSATSDPNKQVTGGFGSALDGQYYPLDGEELKGVVWLLMDEVAKRVQHDLRFTVAVTYPRVRARVQVVVEGYAQDTAILIERAMVPHDRTPEDLAQQLGDEVIFVVRRQRQEFNEHTGASETPANAMREEIGAAIPRKQSVGTGNNRQIVDRIG